MIYCQACGHKNDESVTTCSKCGAVLSATLIDDNERPLVQKLHQAENVARERKDGAMSFIVIGSILLILGIIFFVLSFKLPNATAVSKVLIITCFEFWVSMFGLVVGGASLAFGIALLVLCLMKLQTLKEDIELIRLSKSPIVADKKAQK